jgi:hypothetical protein
MVGQTICFVSATQCDMIPLPAPAPCPAKQFRPRQRQELALEVLAGTQPVSDLARQHQVSRKFLYQQADTAEQALDRAFDPPQAADDVLFSLPVTKAWLRQLVLALVLIGHSSYRGVIALLADLFDTKLSLGTVHNIVHAAVAPAAEINRSYDLAGIHVGAHDEIFQAGWPVLVGVDTASTFCYLLSQEEHRDADTWGVRLLELTDCGFAPDATVADFGTGLRAGQALALPAVPCRGDVFHLVHDLEQVVTYLENRAYEALDRCERLQREQAHQQRQGRPTHAVGQRLRHARAAGDAAVALAEDVRLLGQWLRHDVLAVAGPCHAERRALYDFVLVELQARVSSCPHRLGPIARLLKNRRDDLLAFALVLDEGLATIAAALQAPPERLRRLLRARSREARDPSRWAEEAAVREGLHGRFHEACAAIDALAAGTVRASSLVENLNSRLRNHFTLRRHLGSDYLSLLQFFLNHRPLERSDRPERAGKTPAELLTGQAHPHWLEMLGFTRFERN